MNECPARLAFPTAPYLDVRCHRPPGHDGMHEARTMVRTSTVPFEERHDEYVPPQLQDRDRSQVWLTWNQAVPS